MIVALSGPRRGPCHIGQANMKLSRTVAYAVHAALQLAKADPSTPVPCSKLAEAGKMPERFLLQILRDLVTHGILRSTRGVDGGYSLVRPAEEISLLQVIEAIQGPFDGGVAMSEGVGEESARLLQEKLSEVNEITRTQLDRVKLAHLLPLPTDKPSADAETEIEQRLGGASGPGGIS